MYTNGKCIYVITLNIYIYIYIYVLLNRNKNILTIRNKTLRYISEGVETRYLMTRYDIVTSIVFFYIYLNSFVSPKSKSG